MHSLEDRRRKAGTTSSPAPAGFDIRTGHDADTFVVALYGELDVTGEDRLQTACHRALRAGRPEIVIDLGALSYIDSTGLKALLALRRRALAHHVRLLVFPGPPQVQRAFELCGLMRTFTFADDA